MKISSFFTLCLLVVLLQSCKKEQPEISNPLSGCDCAHEVSADFAMEEKTSGLSSARFTNTDSIYGDKNVRFFAKEEGADYTWYIGNEVLHTREITRFFGNNLVGQTIPVTLVVRKSPNLVCLPGDDGFDSIVKNLYIAQLNTFDFLDTTFVEGVFRMKSPLLNDSVDISIDFRNYSNGNDKRIDIYNYDGQGSNCLNRIGRSQTNYRQFWTFGEATVTQCDYLQGTMHVLLNGTVEMNFSTGGYVDGEYITQQLYYNYKGRKL